MELHLASVCGWEAVTNYEVMFEHLKVFSNFLKSIVYSKNASIFTVIN